MEPETVSMNFLHSLCNIKIYWSILHFECIFLMDGFITSCIGQLENMAHWIMNSSKCWHISHTILEAHI